jgi:hypothetical protein
MIRRFSRILGTDLSVGNELVQVSLQRLRAALHERTHERPDLVHGSVAKESADRVGYNQDLDCWAQSAPIA